MKSGSAEKEAYDKALALPRFVNSRTWCSQVPKKESEKLFATRRPDALSDPMPQRQENVCPPDPPWRAVTVALNMLNNTELSGTATMLNQAVQPEKSATRVAANSARGSIFRMLNND